MNAYLGDFPTGKTIAFPFCTFNAAGASVTLTGLAVTDIEIYKLPSMTQRSSDAGYALIDTDGIDLDGVTGIHGFTVDTADNTDAGFYAAGNDYCVVVASVTVDAQTVNFIAGRFSIDNRGLLRPTVASRTLDVSAGGEAGLDWANIGSPTTAQNLSATNIDVDQVVASVSGAVATVTALAANSVNASALAADAAAEIADAVWDEDATGHQTTGTFGQAIGDPVADTNSIYKAVVTDATGATVGVDVVAVKAQTAAIEVDTAEIGTAGAGLTNINLPNQTMDIVGSITGSLSGSVGSVTGAVGSVTGAVGSVTGAVGSVGSGGISDASFATTAGAFNALGIIDQGTAQSATGTTLVLRSAAAFADDEIIGATIVIVSATAGAGQSRTITDYVSSTDTATVATWTTTPTGTIVYKIHGTSAQTAGSAPTAAEVADAVWDEAQSGHVAGGSFGETATEIAAILVDTGTTLDARIPAALVSGRIDASVGAMAANVLTATAINADAITAAKVAADVTAEIADGVWDEDATGHQTTGTFGQAIGDPVADTNSIYKAVVTDATGATVGVDVVAMKVDTAAILVDTGTTLDARIPAALVSGRIDASVGAMAANVMTAAAAAADLTTELQSGLATAAALATVDGIVDDILLDTAEIGTAGAGLTNINLPNQTMDIVGSITGNLSGSVGSVTGAVGSVTGAVGSVTTVSDKTGYALSAGGVDAILDEVVEGAVTLRESARLWNSAIGSKASGLATTTAVYRDLGDTKDRITATVDSSGNRSAVTHDLT